MAYVFLVVFVTDLLYYLLVSMPLDFIVLLKCNGKYENVDHLALLAIVPLKAFRQSAHTPLQSAEPSLRSPALRAFKNNAVSEIRLND